MIFNRSVLLHCMLCLFVFIGCSDKDTDPPPDPPPPTEEEISLTSGWEVRKLTDSSAWDIQFVDAQNGFFVGDGIFKTTDAGKTWTQSRPPQLPVGVSLEYCSFVDAFTGWAVEKKGNRIFKTIDGGQTFSIATIDGAIKLFQIKFLNKQIGFVTATNGLHRTDDGGISWEKIYDEHCFSLFTLDERTIWVGHSNGLSWTRDGRNFTRFELGGHFISIQFFDKMNGLALSDLNSVYQTDNGGETWKGKLNVEPGIQGNDLHFFDLNNGYVTDVKGIVKVTNNKVSRVVTDKDSNPFEIFFTDPDHGYVGSMKGNVYRYIAPK